ncbi:MAG: glycosylase [Acidobacteria bacterium]|nr:glycosylase [Acidobacteriota bacterium]
MTLDVRDVGVQLLPDPSRVIPRLFLPGEGYARTGSRASDIIGRIEATPPEELRATAARILDSFGSRSEKLPELLRRHAQTVAFRTGEAPPMDPDQELVLGAVFTAEYSVEAAALCNPSAVPHPDQSGLAVGELRLAIALRAIGEGHVSSIAFATAIVDTAREWRFEPRSEPLVSSLVTEGDWTREHFRACLETEGRLNEVSGAIVRALPPVFRSGEIEAAINDVPVELAQRFDTRGDLDVIRTMAWSAYHAAFESGSSLAQRVLLPAASDETNGIEDARFVRFVRPDGRFEYRATYTAYNGHAIAPRLITSPDLVTFSMHRLSGTAARNKGMALFPREVGGVLYALTRTDGENVSVATSPDGLSWTDVAVLRRPAELWEVVQIGNCGSPIETTRGWLVFLHGVGPMRQYSIGAMLLDLDDPTIVRARLTDPLLRPLDEERNGYVPNVVYSCGAVEHAGTIWLPFGVGDQRIRVVSIQRDELLDAMTPE